MWRYTHRLPISWIMLFLLISVLPLPAPLIYRPGEGWEVEGDDAVEETSSAQLAKAERYEKEGKLEEAREAYRKLVKTWPLSPNAPQAQFQDAVVLYKLYEFERSFEEFQACLEKYPETPHFNEILKYQYDIACLFLAGERQKVLRIPLLPSMEKAVEMFEKVIKNGPYSQVAAMAQLKIGFAREKQRHWEDAVKAYQQVIRRYAKSDLADDAQFQVGYALMMAAREANYDQTATEKAVTGFQDYITRYPRSEKVPQAKENIDLLNSKQARALMNIAEFYDRERNDDAALIYYNNVIQKFPAAELAREASVRADRIKLRQQEKISPEPKETQETKEKLEGKKAESSSSAETGASPPANISPRASNPTL